MDAVAGGAVGDVGVAGLRLEPVVGIDERRQTPGLNVVLFVEHRRLVARRASPLGDLRTRDGRQGVVRRQDPVLAVAVGAHRRVGLSASCQLAVNALQVVVLHALVAAAAGVRNVEVVDARFRRARREDLVGGASGGVAVVAGGGHVDPALGRLAVDRPRVDLNRVIDQDVIFGGEVQVFVAPAAGVGEIGGVGGGATHRGGKNVVRPVAVRTVRHVLDHSPSRARPWAWYCSAASSWQLRQPIAADVEVRGQPGGGERCPRSSVAVEAVDAVVDRVRDLVGEGRACRAGFVAVGAHRAVDRLVFLVLSEGDRGRAQPHEEGQNDRCQGDGRLSA